MKPPAGARAFRRTNIRRWAREQRTTTIAHATCARDTRSEFQRSVERLEKAVQGFVSATNEHVTNRAADFVDDTAARLERELRDRRGSARRRRTDDESGCYDSRRVATSIRRRRERWQRARSDGATARRVQPGYRTSRVYQDKRRQKIAGVCAGIARYFGVEVWVVRGIAITGLIFMPSVVIPAYIIAAFVLPKAPQRRSDEPSSDGRDRSLVAGAGTRRAVVAATQPARRSSRSGSNRTEAAPDGIACDVGPIRTATRTQTNRRLTARYSSRLKGNFDGLLHVSVSDGSDRLLDSADEAVAGRAQARESLDSGATTQLQHQVDALQQRVEVLEKIVTDQKYQLQRELASLDDTP